MMREKLIRQLWTMGVLLWVIGAFMLLTGCASLSGDEEPALPAHTVEIPKEPVEVSGSIFQAGREMTLFEDIKARRVGDILTVMLVEQNSGTKSADTSLSQNTAMSVGAPMIGNNSFPEVSLDVGAEGSFAGESGSSQRNSLNGSVSVTVVQVLPGGNLFVQGEKWIEINQGKEFIKLQGVIRPRDVRPNNTILSTQVADARISYSGTGATENSNVVGWIARLLFSPIKLF